MTKGVQEGRTVVVNCHQQQQQHDHDHHRDDARRKSIYVHSKQQQYKKKAITSIAKSVTRRRTANTACTTSSSKSSAIHRRNCNNDNNNNNNNMNMNKNHQYDVYFARGRGVQYKSGNVYYRGLIRQMKKQYQGTTKNQAKNEIASQVVETIASLGGAFYHSASTNITNSKNSKMNKKRKYQENADDDAADSDGTTSTTSSNWDVVPRNKLLIKIKQALRSKITPEEEKEQQEEEEETVKYGELAPAPSPPAATTVAVTIKNNMENTNPQWCKSYQDENYQQDHIISLDELNHGFHRQQDQEGIVVPSMYPKPLIATVANENQQEEDDSKNILMTTPVDISTATDELNDNFTPLPYYYGKIDQDNGSNDNDNAFLPVEIMEFISSEDTFCSSSTNSPRDDVSLSDKDINYLLVASEPEPFSKYTEYVPMEEV